MMNLHICPFSCPVNMNSRAISIYKQETEDVGVEFHAAIGSTKFVIFDNYTSVNQNKFLKRNSTIRNTVIL
jgi:hypothetical protein